MPPNPAALLIGLIVLVYWGRVLRLIHRTRKMAGHGANVIPPDAIGKLTRLIWFPVTILWIALPILRGLGSGRLLIMEPLFLSPVLDWIGVAVAAIALAGTWRCWKTMGKSWRMGIDPREKTQLVKAGLYARVRHPIYALSILLMLATAAVCPTPLMLAVATIHISLLYVETVREEAYLSATHGQEYTQYRRRCGRFLPWA